MFWFHRSSSYNLPDASSSEGLTMPPSADSDIPPRVDGLFRHHSVISEPSTKGAPDVAWVVNDFISDKIGSNASVTEEFLTVHVGQQVEVIDCNPHGFQDYCLVRIIYGPPPGLDSTSYSAPVQEGLVPLSCLRFSARGASMSKSSAEAEDMPVLYSSEPSPSFSSESSSSKRKGGIKKWLTNPVRKLSHGRLDKTSNVADSSKLVGKKSSISGPCSKPPIGREENGNKSNSTRSEEDNSATTSKSATPNKPPLLSNKSKSFDINGSITNPLSTTTTNTTEEDGDATDVELPPPMKIQEHSYPAVQPLSVISSGNATSDNNAESTASTADLAASEIEQIIKDRMEIHSGNLDPSQTSTSENDEKTQEQENTNEGVDSDANDESSTGESEREKSLAKRKYVMQELVETERDYVRDLRGVVEGYLEFMRKEEIPVPDDLKNGKDKIVFGNIEAIFEWHRDSFLAELEKCLEEPERLGLLFRRYERRLNMYVVYCQNKPKSEYIVSEYMDTYFEELRQKLGHKLQLPDLLIKPIQRITKYQLMLKDIYKYTEKAGLEKEAEDLRKAVHIMHVVPKAANDMMNVGRLQGFDGKLTAQGKLLLQGVLQVSEGSSSSASAKFKERQVFLFEQIIIFSEAVGQKTQFSNPVYIHKNHLQVNKMSLQEKVDDGDPCKFLLKSKDPQQEGVSFLIQGQTPEMRSEWVSNIRAILDTQLDFLRALQSPIAYQKELTKEV